MNSAKSRRLAVAFTLVEMLVVIGIIAILAALLLPALSASQLRAKRIVCESQLRQMGIAFQSFAHDHNGKFPMQVATNGGGSLEFVQNGYLMNGPSYFAFRHFQPLAGILDTPKILVCPADARPAATNFATLRNSNLSYFVGVSAEYSQPMSLLAGDGNLAVASTIVREAAGGRLTWTGQQHRFKGNLLLADGHVEEWGNHSVGALSRSGDFVLPSLGTGTPSSAMAAASPTDDTNSAAPGEVKTAQSNSRTNQPGRPPTNQPALFAAASASRHDTRVNAVEQQPQTDATNPVVENFPITNNSPGGKVSSPMDYDSMMSPFDRQIAKVLREFIIGTYLLILLLFLIFTAYRIWRWSQNPERKRRG